jgi:hypothetical protein
MGWSSGTEIFDAGLNIFLKYVPEEAIDSVLLHWYDVVTAQDWDTVEESDYYDMLRPVLVANGELDDDDDVHPG